MALIKCPECQHEVSSSARNCPSCGHKLREDKSPLQYALVIIGLLILGLIAYYRTTGDWYEFNSGSKSLLLISGIVCLIAGLFLGLIENIKTGKWW
jgi:uncharacterized protein (DUF983 family)